MTRAEAETKLQQLLDRYERRMDTANVAFVLSQVAFIALAQVPLDRWRSFQKA